MPDTDALTEAQQFARLEELFASGEAEEIRGDVPRAVAARAAGVSHITVGRWERGERRANSPEALRYLTVLEAIAHVRGIDT